LGSTILQSGEVDKQKKVDGMTVAVPWILGEGGERGGTGKGQNTTAGDESMAAWQR